MDDVNTTDAARTVPAIQWSVTQSNSTPALGRNAVKSSVSIDAAISQWNPRATREWRGTRSGIAAITSGAVVPDHCFSPAKNLM